jgi:DNA-binding transcriptional ArsR family regulator/protein-L-isoaspartate O-methyltransferase
MDDLEQRAAFLAILADPTRLRLLKTLSEGELTVAELTRVTGLSQPRVSRHLKLLAEAGLLGRTPDQNEVYYRLGDDPARTGGVHMALEGLREDPVLRRDLERLEAILDQRQEKAAQLLERLGVRPLGDGTLAAVERTIDALLDRHAPGKALGDLLDVGTGAGTMLRVLGGRVRTAVGIDPSRDMRVVARASVLCEGLANCSVRDGDMYALGFAPASFDLVTMDRALGAGERPGDAVAEAARVLRPGGYLLVVETTGSQVSEQALTRWTHDAGLTLLESSHPASAFVALSQHAA